MSGNITEIGPRRAALQIARIAALLGELEDLSRHGTDMPLPLLRQTRVSIVKARTVLRDCERVAGRPELKREGEGDPQPDVDRDVLDQMYRILRTGRRPPER